MADRKLLKEWFDIVNLDIATAEHMTTMRWPKPDSVICYHCQQTAEKSLKAFLVLHDVDPPRSHNLPELLQLCKSFNPDFSQLTTACDFLNPYGSMPRYPNELQITGDDAAVALSYAKAIKEFVMAFLPDFEKPDGE